MRSAHEGSWAKVFLERAAKSYVSALSTQPGVFLQDDKMCIPRLMIKKLLCDFIDRTASFLGEPRWKYVPFAEGYPSKDVLDLLLDVLVEMPGVLEAMDQFKESEDSQHGSEIADWLHRLTMELEAWRTTWILTYPALLQMLRSQTPSLSELCTLCIDAKPYDDLLGESINCYCAGHIIVAGAYFELVQRKSIPPDKYPPPYSMAELVQGVIRISENHLETSNIGMGNIVIVTFPLRIAHRVVAGRNPEADGKIAALRARTNEHLWRRFNVGYKQPTLEGQEFKKIADE